MSVWNFAYGVECRVALAAYYAAQIKANRLFLACKPQHLVANSHRQPSNLDWDPEMHDLDRATGELVAARLRESADLKESDIATAVADVIRIANGEEGRS